MKILFTSHHFYPDVGGIEVHSETLAPLFVAAGHDVLLVTQTPGDHSNDEEKFPFKILRVPSRKELFDAYRWAEIVYQNNIELGTLWPWILFRRPLVVAIHTWIRSQGRRRPVDWMKIGFLHLASRVVAVSDAIRKDSFAQAAVIGNPYRDKLFRLIPEVPRNKTIAFVGRLVSDKGCDLLLRAFARISKRPEFLESLRGGVFQPRVTLIGEGPEEDKLRALAAELGLGDSVHFAGRLTGENLVRMLNEHQILAVPSLWNEPFGIVALEGVACGCVVVGSDAGGLPDAIGKAGLLFRQGDVEDLAEKILSILTSAGMAANLRSQSREHLLAHGEGVVCEKYLAILADAARPKPPKTYD